MLLHLFGGIKVNHVVFSTALALPYGEYRVFCCYQGSFPKGQKVTTFQDLIFLSNLGIKRQIDMFINTKLFTTLTIIDNLNQLKCIILYHLKCKIVKGSIFLAAGRVRRRSPRSQYYSPSVAFNSNKVFGRIVLSFLALLSVA